MLEGARWIEGWGVGNGEFTEMNIHVVDAGR